MGRHMDFLVGISLIFRFITTQNLIYCSYTIYARTAAAHSQNSHAKLYGNLIT